MSEEENTMKENVNEPALEEAKNEESSKNENENEKANENEEPVKEEQEKEEILSESDYLEKNVTDAVQKGMLELVQQKPDNPLKFLGDFLLEEANKMKK
jgi:COMPASS component SDC1